MSLLFLALNALSFVPNYGCQKMELNKDATLAVSHVTMLYSAYCIFLKGLTSLDVSHNPLYDGCLTELSSLIANLPRLGRLSLSSCCVSMKLFQNDRLQLLTALQSKSFKGLDEL